MDTNFILKNSDFFKVFPIEDSEKFNSMTEKRKHVFYIECDISFSKIEGSEFESFDIHN